MYEIAQRFGLEEPRSVARCLSLRELTGDSPAVGTRESRALACCPRAPGPSRDPCTWLWCIAVPECGRAKHRAALRQS